MDFISISFSKGKKDEERKHRHGKFLTLDFCQNTNLFRNKMSKIYKTGNADECWFVDWIKPTIYSLGKMNRVWIQNFIRRFPNAYAGTTYLLKRRGQEYFTLVLKKLFKSHSSFVILSDTALAGLPRWSYCSERKWSEGWIGSLYQWCF